MNIIHTDFWTIEEAYEKGIQKALNITKTPEFVKTLKSHRATRPSFISDK